jgi:hypothetical protein
VLASELPLFGLNKNGEKNHNPSHQEAMGEVISLTGLDNILPLFLAYHRSIHLKINKTTKHGN